MFSDGATLCLVLRDNLFIFNYTCVRKRRQLSSYYGLLDDLSASRTKLGVINSRLKVKGLSKYRNKDKQFITRLSGLLLNWHSFIVVLISIHAKACTS